MNEANSDDVATCRTCKGEIFRTNVDGRWHHPGSAVDHKAEPAEEKPPTLLGTEWLASPPSGPQTEVLGGVRDLYREAQIVEAWGGADSHFARAYDKGSPDEAGPGFVPMKSEPGTEVARFADVAMFEAEPVEAASGPQVFVLSMNPDPLGAAAAAMAMYRGQVVRDLAEITDEQRREVITAMRNTKLKAPLEFIKVHFLLEGVTRAFTHQMVRQRTAVFAQESMRFAVKGGMAAATALPPTLAQFNDPEAVRDLDERIEDGRDNQIHVSLSTAEKQFLAWREATEAIEQGYDQLINLGMPAEDARGLAPTNVLTRLHYATDFRNLSDHAGNRLCTQAQFEWRLVFIRLAAALRSFGSRQVYRTTVPALDGGGLPSRTETQVVSRTSSWQFDALADFFRPACYLTGKCEFAAMDLDRACKIRNRVDANHEIGRPSAEWDQEHDVVDPGAIAVGVGPQSVVRDEANVPVFIGAIQPAEWLLDPAAARQKPGRA